MSPALESLLFERYPLLFAERQLLPEETGMCWGCQCDDGWFTLVDALCERLQWWCDHHETPQVVLTQVKEKFGELRVHLRGASPEQSGMIEMMRAMSSRICEVCGRPALHAHGEAALVARCQAICTACVGSGHS